MVLGKSHGTKQSYMSLYCDWDNDPSYKIILNNNEIRSSYEETFLGILLDGKLNFDSHITPVCKNGKKQTNKETNKQSKPKTSYFWKNKLLTYPRSENLAIILSSKIVIQSLSLIWMFISRYLNNALNNKHERALNLIYNDYELAFNRILKDNK